MKVGRSDLEPIILAGLKSLGGKGRVVDVARYIWNAHEGDLRGSGDFFFIWQYDMRRAAENLRTAGKLKPVDRSTKLWEIA